MGFLSLNCPFFQFFLQILIIYIDLRVVLEHIFILLKRFRCCIIEIHIHYCPDKD